MAEQLLWISTSLRKPSGEATERTLCTAELIPENFLNHGTIPYKHYHQRCLGVVAFRVVYTADPLLKESRATEGDCWMELFRSSSLVAGYPIPSRKHRMPGLEMPLHIMACLIGAERITPFGHDLIIKGYSDLFYVTGIRDEYLIWHLICNKDTQERISFADARIPLPTDHKLSLLRPAEVLSMRHIVGWTNTVRSNAG